MNCREAQEQITDSLAAGLAVSALPPGVTSHWKACAECQVFYSKEQQLFGSVENGLQHVVNQRVPPSLLPRVRSGLEQAPERGFSWTLGLGLGAVAALAILAAGVAHFRRTSDNPSSSPVVVAAVASQNRGSEGTIGTRDKRATRVTLRKRKNVGTKIPVESAPEVLVSAEERLAFARFVAEIPAENDWAVALSHPAVANEDVPVEIALLDFGSVEVKPLPREARE